MKRIHLLSDQPERFSRLAERVNADGGYELRRTGLEEVLAASPGSAPELIIIDEAAGGRQGLEIARDVVMTNPMINLAVASSLSEHDFHEAAEGLGILVHLPVHPGEKDAERLMAALSGL